MESPTNSQASSPTLIRGMGLGSATALNMIDMIGVGPFITMPLVVGAMGGPQAMLGWMLGALLAVCDGLVSAELGAALARVGRIVSLSARDLRPAEMGTPDFVPVYLAGIVQRSALHCHRMHRPGGIRGLLLAGTGNGVRASRGRAAHSVGRNVCR